MEPPGLGLSTWPVLWQVGRGPCGGPPQARSEEIPGVIQAQASPALTGLHLTQNCPLAYFPQLPRQGGMFWKGGRACDWDRPLTEFLSSTCHVPAVEAWGNSLVPFGSIRLVDRANESCLLLLGGCPCNERLLPLCNTQNTQVVRGMDEARQLLGQGTSEPIGSSFFYPDQPQIP